MGTFDGPAYRKLREQFIWLMRPHRLGLATVKGRRQHYITFVPPEDGSNVHRGHPTGHASRELSPTVDLSPMKPPTTSSSWFLELYQQPQWRWYSQT